MHAVGKMKIGAATIKNSMKFPQKILKIEPLYDSIVSPLGPHLQDVK